jgi:hypothetical protein
MFFDDLLSRPVEPGPDRAHLDAENLGALLPGESLPLLEDEHVPVTARQGPDDSGHGLAN